MIFKEGNFPWKSNNVNKMKINKSYRKIIMNNKMKSTILLENVMN